MSHLNSAGKLLRTLPNRRQRTEEQPLTEQKAPSAGKPAQPERNDLPPVAGGQSNLQAQIPLEKKADPLTLFGDFLDATAIEAFGEEAIDHDEIADLHPYVHFVPDNKGNLNAHLMSIADKRVHQSGQLTVKAEPDLGPGVRLVEHRRATAGGDFEKVHMACADKQPQRPASVVKADAADHPMGEIVDQLYKEKEEAAKKADATPTSTPQQPATNAGPAQPQTAPVTTPPDTRNDHKIALQEQVKESVDDLKFWTGIEQRLKKIAETYDDPKGEVKALYEGTQQLVQDLGKLYNKFKGDYEQQYGNADPMQGQLEDLSKLGQGDKSQPRERTGDGSRRTKQQPIGSKEYARLRREFQNSVAKDSKRADTSKEDDDDLDLRQYTARANNIRRQTAELEETTRNDKRKKEREFRESTDASQELIESPEAEKTPVVTKAYDDSNKELVSPSQQ